ncbi:hypothetical protein T4A_4717, partial [Trichinella pseudospiralis]
LIFAEQKHRHTICEFRFNLIILENPYLDTSQLIKTLIEAQLLFKSVFHFGEKYM